MGIQKMNNQATDLIRNMLLSAALLGFFGLLGTTMVLSVNLLTKEQIEKNIKADLLNSLNTIIIPSSYNNNLLERKLSIKPAAILGKRNRPTTVYQAFMDDKPIAIAFDIIAPDGYSGKIKFLIGITLKGEISGVRVISHKETPGLGDKIEIKRSDWITSFNQKSLKNTSKKNWNVKKDGGEFDQFTGATITPRAIVKAVHKALQYYKMNQSKLYLTQAEYDKVKQ